MNQVELDKRTADFWAWVAANKAELDALESPDDPFWDDALLELQAINDELWFEMSAPSDGLREFVITAQGQTELFPLVEAVVANAPDLPGWTVVALKPPMGFDFSLRYQGIELNPHEMWFLPLLSDETPHLLGLRVAVPGFVPELEDDCGNGVLILLDTGLGERAAALDVELVDVCELPQFPDDEGYIPFSELSNYIDWRKHKQRANA